APERALAAAKDDPERAVDEDVAEGIAEPAAHRAEPRVGEPPGREAILRARDIEIGLATEHEIAGLPVVAAAHAARDAGGLRRVVGGVAPLIAELAAEI